MDIRKDKALGVSLLAISSEIYGFSKESVIQLFKANNLQLDLELYDHLRSSENIALVEATLVNGPAKSVEVKEVVQAPKAPVAAQTPAIDFSDFF